MIYEPEDFDKIQDPEHYEQAKKEFLAKLERLRAKREREIAELKTQFGEIDG